MRRKKRRKKKRSNITTKQHKWQVLSISLLHVLCPKGKIEHWAGQSKIQQDTNGETDRLSDVRRRKKERKKRKKEKGCGWIIRKEGKEEKENKNKGRKEWSKSTDFPKSQMKHFSFLLTLTRWRPKAHSHQKEALINGLLLESSGHSIQVKRNHFRPVCVYMCMWVSV